MANTPCQHLWTSFSDSVHTPGNFKNSCRTNTSEVPSWNAYNTREDVDLDRKARAEVVASTVPWWSWTTHWAERRMAWTLIWDKIIWYVPFLRFILVISLFPQPIRRSTCRLFKLPSLSSQPALQIKCLFWFLICFDNKSNLRAPDVKRPSTMSMEA